MTVNIVKRLLKRNSAIAINMLRETFLETMNILALGINIRIRSPAEQKLTVFSALKPWEAHGFHHFSKKINIILTIFPIFLWFSPL